MTYAGALMEYYAADPTTRKEELGRAVENLDGWATVPIRVAAAILHMCLKAGAADAKLLNDVMSAVEKSCYDDTKLKPFVNYVGVLADVCLSNELLAKHITTAHLCHVLHEPSRSKVYVSQDLLTQLLLHVGTIMEARPHLQTNAVH